MGLNLKSHECADELIEVPSCVESLANSAGQLRQLADQASQFYAKIILCYGHTSESNNMDEAFNQEPGRITRPAGSQAKRDQLKDLEQLANDKNVLKLLDSTVRILPVLNELCLFIERCLVTVESSMRRIIYYLNLTSQRISTGAQQSSLGYSDLQLTHDVQLDAIFVALMDLMFALISLDKTLEDHTSLAQGLYFFHNLLSKLVNYMNGTKTLESILGSEASPSRDNISKLHEMIGSIITHIGIGRDGKADAAIFRQCIDRVQYLNLILINERTLAGYKLFNQIFEEFLIFYSDHLVELSAQKIDLSQSDPKFARTIACILINTNLVPTTYMTTLTRKFFGLASLSIFFSSLFNQTTNKRVYRAINQAIQRTKPNDIVLLDNTNSHLYLTEFLLVHMPKSTIETKTFDLLSSQMNIDKETNAEHEFQRLSLKTTQWLVRLKKEALDHEQMQLSDWPKRQILLFDQGLKLAAEISTTVRCISLAQQRLSLVTDKHNLIGFYRLSILLESIRTSMSRQELFVSTVMLKIENFVRTQWRQLLANFQKRQVSMKYSDRKMNLDTTIQLSSLTGCVELLAVHQGRIVLSVCLSMLLPLFNEAELKALNMILDLMRFQFFERLDAFTNCNHLYWHIPTIGTYYNHALDDLNGAINEVNLLHSALLDVKQLLAISHKPSWSQIDINWLLQERDRFQQRLSLELVDQFKDDYLDRICQELEIELRLQAHKDLYLNDTNPDSNPINRHLYDFRQIFGCSSPNRVTTFQLFNYRINLNYYVEQYLNRVCYDLTALAPHDWLTYDNMMNLARHKYGLKFVDTQLPVQTLDSGLDLLDITRNLASFAARYSYDFTNQLFIEKCLSNRLSTTSSVQSVGSSFSPQNMNQLLNTFQSHHVVQSVQTHGYGTLDSAVNCTYLTLKRLVNLFSRQLSDEKLRAVLQKEHQQMFPDSRGGRICNRTITYSKANRMAKQFRLNIGNLSELSTQSEMPNSGQHRVDLDSIRQTVTQIGNLLAFVRFIKSGALSSASRSVEYVPNLNDLSNLRLGKCAESEFADYESYAILRDAASNFDQCLEDFADNFSPKTNYLKIIVNLFSGLLSNNTKTREKEADCDRTTNDSNQSGNSKQTEESSSHSATKANVSDHLELFFLVIPALTINYIDHLTNCKERALSRSPAARFGALLSDDGFAIGIAFLLAVLNQTNNFNKLNWLEETCLKLQADIDEVGKRLEDPKYEASLKQTSTMTLRRLKKLNSEYIALDQTLTCALLLFENF